MAKIKPIALNEKKLSLVAEAIRSSELRLDEDKRTDEEVVSEYITNVVRNLVIQYK